MAGVSVSFLTLLTEVTVLKYGEGRPVQPGPGLGFSAAFHLELKIKIINLSLNSGTAKKQAAPCCSLVLFASLKFRGRNSQTIYKPYKAKLPFIQNALRRNLYDVCGFSFDNQVKLFT